MNRFSSLTLFALLATAGAGVAIGASACGGGGSSATATSGAGASDSTASNNPTSSGKGGASSTGGMGGSTGVGFGGTMVTVGGMGGGNGCMAGGANDDVDKDGYTPAMGDCNDCDANVNPGAVEVIGKAPDGGTYTAVDEDCDGMKDNVAQPCDGALVETSMDPLDGAKAIGLCDKRFLVSAKWVQADGSAPPAADPGLTNFHLGHGLIDGIGPNLMPQEGKVMLDVSSGMARKPTDPGYVHRNFDKGYTGNPPPGFPKESPSCPGTVTGPVHDATALEVDLKAPTNAEAFTFDFNFFTFEWPQFICTTYNDFFIANMVPFPAMQTDGNISFDPMGNPISVNNAFLDVCGCPSSPGDCMVPPKAPVKDFKCSLGKTGVTGTDWSIDTGMTSLPGWTNGSTGWLQTSAPVTANLAFTLRFVTYDSGDGNVDSSAMVDNFQWSAEPGTVQTVIQGPPK